MKRILKMLDRVKEMRLRKNVEISEQQVSIMLDLSKTLFVCPKQMFALRLYTFSILATSFASGSLERVWG